jgi:hypothetical protein
MNPLEQFLNSLPKPYLSPVVETRVSPIAGVGQFAKRDIEPGEVVAIESGPILSGEVVSAIGAMGYSLDTCVGWGQLMVSGLLAHGGEGGIINHSCDPNVGFIGDAVYATIRPVGRGEELCCDYGTFETTRGWSMACHCGTSQCRKTITARDFLLPDLQARLGKWFMPYLKRYLKEIGEQ